jgi:hypothetical protein
MSRFLINTTSTVLQSIINVVLRSVAADVDNVLLPCFVRPGRRARGGRGDD